MFPSRLFIDSMFDDLKDNLKCDIYELDNNYHIEVDIPGFSRENIKIEFNNGTLIIIAEKNYEEDENTKKYIRRERKLYGKFQRSFYFGEIDEENIEASFNNGILTIILSKKSEEDIKKIIEIK